VGSRTGLDNVEKKKFLTPPGFELRPLVRSARKLVVIPTSLSRILCKRNDRI
jgi:hypothetical protein